MDDPRDTWISSNQASRILGVEKRTLKRWEAKGLIHPKRNLFGWRYYKKSEILELRKKHKLED